MTDENSIGDGSSRFAYLVADTGIEFPRHLPLHLLLEVGSADRNNQF